MFANVHRWYKRSLESEQCVIPVNLVFDGQINVVTYLSKFAKNIWWMKYILPSKYRISILGPRFKNKLGEYVRKPLSIKTNPCLRGDTCGWSAQQRRSLYNPGVYMNLVNFLVQDFRKTSKNKDNKMVSAYAMRRLYQIISTVDQYLLAIYMSRLNRVIDNRDYLKKMLQLFSKLLQPGSFARLKRERKELRRNLLSNNLNFKINIGSNLTVISKDIAYLKKNYGSKEYGYITMMLTQTRALGLPSKKQMKLSRDKFIKTLTTKPQKIKVDVEKYCTRYLQSRYHVLNYPPKAKVIFGSSASYRSTRRKGGAKVELSKLYKEFKPSYYISLEDFKPRKIKERLTYGEKIFYSSLHRILHRKSVPKHRFAQIVEPGNKARSLTMNEAEVTSVLSVYNKMILHALRSYPEISSGISEERHGWAACRAMENIFKSSKGDLLGLSYDLEESTDFVPFELINGILKSVNRVFAIPDEYGKLVLKLMTIPHLIEFKDGSIKTVRGALMGSPVTKVILTLGQATAYQMTYEKFNLCKLFARFVGDDGIMLSNNRKALIAHIYNLKSLGFKISDLDTYISKRYIHFCEELIMIPRNGYYTIQSCIARQDYRSLPYVDYPKLKLLSAISTNNKMDTLRDPNGKIQLLNKDCRYSRGTDVESNFTVAALIQIVLLSHLTKSTIYLPTIFGGCGRVPSCIEEYRIYEAHRLSKPMSRFMSTVLKEIADGKPDSRILSIISRYGFRHNRFFDKEEWMMRVDDIDLPNNVKKLMVLDPMIKPIHPQVYGRLAQVLVPENKLKILHESSKAVIEYIEFGVEPEPIFYEDKVEEKYKEFLVKECHDSVIVKAFKLLIEYGGRDIATKKDKLYLPEAMDYFHSNFMNVKVDIDVVKTSFLKFRDTPKTDKGDEDAEIIKAAKSGDLSKIRDSIFESDHLILKEVYKDPPRVSVIVTDDIKLVKKILTYGVMKVYRIPSHYFISNFVKKDPLKILKKKNKVDLFMSLLDDDMDFNPEDLKKVTDPDVNNKPLEESLSVVDHLKKMFDVKLEDQFDTQLFEKKFQEGKFFYDWGSIKAARAKLLNLGIGEVIYEPKEQGFRDDYWTKHKVVKKSKTGIPINKIWKLYTRTNLI